MTLRKAVAAFRRHAREKGWDRQETASGQCGIASASFCTALRFHCLPVPVDVVTLVASKQRRANTHAPFVYHAVARVGEHYYDWTRRQYDPTASFPTVQTRAEIEADGFAFDEVARR